MKKLTIIAAATFIAMLSGCASTVPTWSVAAQVVDGTGCYKSTYGGAQNVPTVDYSVCQDVVIQDSAGNQKQVNLISSARPGDWVELRCRDTSKGEVCSQRAEKVTNSLKLAKLKETTF